MPQERYESLLLGRTHARRCWENQPAVGVRIEELDAEEVLRTREDAVRHRRISAGTSMDVGDILDRLGLRIDGVLTQAAQMLYGTRFLPDYQARLKLGRFAGRKSTGDILDNKQEYEAYVRAEEIAAKLANASGGPLGEIADRLRQMGGTQRPLAVARLRGGVFRDDGWARLPSQPAVITSTVDQLGSRLLFRGYGRSPRAAPIFSGLAANESLILLDEAHCSVPFLQTLRAIETLRGPEWTEAPVPAPFGFVVLSATPPKAIAREKVFPGDEREQALAHPVLSQRLHASKRAALAELKVKRGGCADPLIFEAGDRAIQYLDDRKQRVAVMVNRVRTAREIGDALGERLKGHAEVVLLTGRLRPFERDLLVEQWSPFLKAQPPENPEKPIVVVSTQCLEVGADFSFDALVTECASLDALRQRFGRLNRMGEAAVSPATILIRDRDADLGKAEPDPIYGTALANTWALLVAVREKGAQAVDRHGEPGV